MGRTVFCAVAIALSLTAPALAQTSASGSAAPAGQAANQTQGSPSTPSQPNSAVAPVTVTGKQPEYRRDADRRSYNIASDLNAANGSIADALRDIPSVDVDQQGNVSLRGDSNVTILIDGQPSALFNGPNKADLIRQLPANQYERVEVMTNPSAAYSPEGTGGIINLITKKTRTAPATATVSAGASTLGDVRASASGNWGVGKVQFTGSLTVSRLVENLVNATTGQAEDAVSGETAETFFQRDLPETEWLGSASGQATYAVNAATRLTESLQLVDGLLRVPFDDIYRSSALTGVLAQDYDGFSFQRAQLTGISSASSVRHDFSGQDHYAIVSVSLQRRVVSGDVVDSTFVYSLPVQPDLYQALDIGNSTDQADLKAEYHGPLAGGAKLVVGYELNFQRQTQARATDIGTDPADAMSVAAYVNEFAGEQTVNSLYATYDHPFGRLDVMPGLRLEDVVISTDDTTEGVRGGQSYFQPYPTLDLAYELDQFTRLTASYSRRIDRAPLNDLDPARLYNDPLLFVQGDPELKPTITDSYEIAYEHDSKTLHYLVSLYYKDKGDLVTQLSESLPGGAVLTTWGNVGHDQSAGLELTADGQITKTLSFRATLETFWDDLNDPAVVFGGTREGVTVFGNVKLSWTPTPNDLVQLDLHAHALQVTAQGSNGPWEITNLGYRRRLTDRISAEVRISDAFAGNDAIYINDTPTLKQRRFSVLYDRSAFLTLSYTFGRVARQGSRDIDFGGAGAGAPGAAGGP